MNTNSQNENSVSSGESSDSFDGFKKSLSSIKDPVNFFNREISFIEFNKRVLAEAMDKKHPLLERLKFASIISSNLDEFFMIRVAGLIGQVASEVEELSYDGMTPRQQLREIRKQLLPLYKNQSKLVTEDIIPALEKEDIIIHEYDSISPKEKKYLQNYFMEHVLPVLTPLSLDPAHPFPRIINLRLNVAFVLNDHSKKVTERRIAFMQIPTVLSRFVKLERPKGYHFVLLEQVIKASAEILFPGLEIIAANSFRVTRDADIEIADDEAEDLLSEISEQIKHRRWGTAVVRLEVNSNMPEYLVKLLTEYLEIEPSDVYVHERPLNMPDFMFLTKLDIPHLKDTPFSSRKLNEFQAVSGKIFDTLKKKDLLVHHPYDSFSTSTLRFVNEAADDPDVIAIKITLYRTGLNSPVVAALKRAAENGKDVTAFVELKARFDEENNIIWAKELEHAGAHVVYGVLGLKTHCKIALIVRKESGSLRSYMHLSTGNYNYGTSRLYTDIGLFTSNDESGLDAIHLFNYLTGYSYHKDYKEFIVAPVNLYKKLLEYIHREIELHTPENPGLIIAKMNSLAHRDIIPALYKASQKGVKIQLLIRGICCLRPGVEGLSENIEVRSILGRFLEHSRIFYFKNGGDEEYYLSSADWMSRNLHNRVELMFKSHDKKVHKHLCEILNVYWKDNTKSWRLLQNGHYERIKPLKGEAPVCAQDHFMNVSRLHREKSRR